MYFRIIFPSTLKAIRLWSVNSNRVFYGLEGLDSLEARVCGRYKETRQRRSEAY